MKSVHRRTIEGISLESVQKCFSVPVFTNVLVVVNLFRGLSPSDPVQIVDRRGFVWTKRHKRLKDRVCRGGTG